MIQDWGIDRRASDDDLAFGERGEVAAHAFRRAVLVNGIDDAQDELCHTLGEHTGIEFAGAD